MRFGGERRPGLSERSGVAGLDQAAGLPGFRDALYAGASSRGSDGVERRGLRRLLALSEERAVMAERDVDLSCPVPFGPGDAVQLAHGGGGRVMQRLLDAVFLPFRMQSFTETPR